MSMIEIRIPDIGDFKDVPIIEVHVKTGDSGGGRPVADAGVRQGDAGGAVPQAGTIGEVKVKTGDRVSEGDLIVLLEAEGGAAIPPKEKAQGGRRPRPAMSRRATAPRREPMTRSRSRFRYR